MTYWQFIRLQWLSTFRSRAFKSNWGMKILIGFLVLYFGSAFLILGIFMPEILEEQLTEGDTIVGLFASGMLYYTLLDLVVRYFMQDLNIMKIQHYLILPVSKGRVLHYFLRNSIFNFFNLLPLFFIVPFAFRGVQPQFGNVAAVHWLVAALFLVLVNHFLAYYLKRVVAVQAKVVIIAALIVVGLLVGDSAGWFSLQALSGTLYLPLAQYWYAALLPLLLMLLLYRVNYRFLFILSYQDRWLTKAREISTQRFTFLERWGLMGTLVANEIKLIQRNKRTRQVMVSMFLLAFYGLIFYVSDKYGMGWHLFAGIFMTGVGAINYGQFLTSWESAFFDGILTRSISLKEYYWGKFWLLMGFNIIMYILTLAYVFIDFEALYIHTAAFLYNSGINIFVLLYASTYNKKAIDLSKGSSLNYQGTSAVQFILILPLMLLPMLLFLGFHYLGAPYWGLFTLGALGVLGMLFSKYFINETVKNFYEKKYLKAAGFRENS